MTSDRFRALAIAQAVADELLGRAAQLYQSGDRANADMYRNHAVGAATVVNALKELLAEPPDPTTT